MAKGLCSFPVRSPTELTSNFEPNLVMPPVLPRAPRRSVKKDNPSPRQSLVLSGRPGIRPAAPRGSTSKDGVTPRPSFHATIAESFMDLIPRNTRMLGFEPPAWTSVPSISGHTPIRVKFYKQLTILFLRQCSYENILAIIIHAAATRYLLSNTLPPGRTR